MPGSTTTGTAPALKIANVSAKNSRLGLTIKTVRTPRPMPWASRPAAITSLSRSSSAHVYDAYSRVPSGARLRSG